MIVLLVDAAPLEPVSVLFGFDVKIMGISHFKTRWNLTEWSSTASVRFRTSVLYNDQPAQTAEMWSEGLFSSFFESFGLLFSKELLDCLLRFLDTLSILFSLSLSPFKAGL